MSGWGGLDTRLVVRISSQELRVLRLLAQRAGAPSLSAFVRETLRDRADEIMSDAAGEA